MFGNQDRLFERTLAVWRIKLITKSSFIKKSQQNGSDLAMGKILYE